MADPFWPGDERAGSLFSGPALLDAMCRVEAAWLAALVDMRVAGPEARDDLAGLAGPSDVARVATGAEAGGNPVIPLLGLLRERLRARNPAAADWLHKGLTSQDVLDSALMRCAADLLERLRGELSDQISGLVELTERHRGTPMAGRTLTQHAVPITFGLKAAQWLTGVLDAAEDLAALTLPAQFGGAAGTLAGAAELARLAGLPDPPARGNELATRAAAMLGLRAGPPWHTARAPVTRLGDALVRATDAWGRIAADVLTLSRPEVGELAEGTGGGSSTMPHKANPVLSVLVRRAALAAPPEAARLHLAAADARDERPDGAWHLEWSALATLGRHTATAAGQTTELLRGLRVFPDRMAATARSSADALFAERRSLAPAATGDYLGAADLIIDAVLDRAHRLKVQP
ncbi:3-carboxy-cis,cis-muconate cycloisomerase [Pseudonocardia eucalypti]|uniref:3-carboxy-cis,cis-muconate cycloisomerase n=1 Tax=Pseudonocardia eucalypti TaxID=648755 RepID=A0ABP9R2B3_9PSEU|nr:3-carboxy-cis,cis-muconate cycloisomerase [Pseudonocardia eucalypti]